jgi:hypothetical protein
MNTKQHNLNPVERTIVASGLLGRVGQRHTASPVYPGAGSIVSADILRPIQPDAECGWLDAGSAAGKPDCFGLFADQTGHRPLS